MPRANEPSVRSSPGANIFEVNAAKAMYINKELKYCQGSDSGKTKPLLIHGEIRELHVGHKDSAVWILRLKAQGLEVISCIAIFIFKPFYLFHCIYNEENFSFHNSCRSQKISFQ